MTGSIHLSHRMVLHTGRFYESYDTNKGRRIYMLVTILQSLLKFTLILSVIFGLAFMVACTVFVIICLVYSDIKISIVRSKTENEKK